MLSSISWMAIDQQQQICNMKLNKNQQKRSKTRVLCESGAQYSVILSRNIYIYTYIFILVYMQLPPKNILYGFPLAFVYALVLCSLTSNFYSSSAAAAKVSTAYG